MPSDYRHHSLAPRRLPTFNYRDPDHAYFVTACAHHGTPFTDQRLATEVITSLHWLRTHRGVKLYAYCLMPDHVHLLLQLGNDQYPLGGIMRAFKTFTTRQSWGLEYRGALWQARFYDHIVREGEAAMRIAAYILNNPVRKGLVEKAEMYPWSGMPDAMERRGI